MRSLSLSSERFQELARALTEVSASYLQKLPQLPTFPPAITGVDTERLFAGDAPAEGIGDEAFHALASIFEHSRPASPRFFGYVFGSGEPIGMLGEFAATVLHQNVTAWRSAPAAVTIERTVVRWLADAIGCYGYTGSLTLGGSFANLMGLCIAREAKAPANQSGVRRGSVLYCSSEAHMSIQKAAALLGLGHDAVRLIEVDEMFRMPTERLRQEIMHDLENGKTPIAVVASAGTTTTGSIDPLAEIADLCQEFDLWLHVDGAYGAFAAMVIPEAFRGLARADSISLDPHKWLYQPNGCGCLLFRDPTAAQSAFAHSGEYARALSDDPIEGFAFFDESMELSRPFRALKIWLSLRYHGLKAFQESIREDLGLAQLLADLVDAEPLLERLAPVSLSAVCFRHVGKTGDLNVLNRTILDKVVRRGRVYLSNARIGDAFALRACVVNHRTTKEDIQSIIDEVLASEEEVVSQAI